MSLLRLLTAGKSLVGGDKGAGRYHVPRGRVLPRFGGKKNPFRTTTHPEQQGATKPEPAGQGAAETVDRAAPAPEMVVRPIAVQKASEPVVELTTPVLAVEESPAAVPLRAPSSRSWMGRMADAIRSRMPKKRAIQPFAASAGVSRRLVQTELLLEKVSVVRNDLNDSDLEVVPARSRSEPSPGSKSGQGAPAKRERWSRVGGRLFGRTQEPAERRG